MIDDFTLTHLFYITENSNWLYLPEIIFITIHFLSRAIKKLQLYSQ